MKFQGHSGLGYNDIVVTFGQLLFWLFKTQAVAKAVYSLERSERLHHEYDVYQCLYSLQGVGIPILYGLYYNNTDGSCVLILSNAGVGLSDFSILSLKDRWVI